MSGYKHGGLDYKYTILKRCKTCLGSGVTGSPDKMVFCEDCFGSGVSATKPDAKYFVLRYDKDPHAIKALKAYAVSVKVDNEQLAADLRAEIAAMEGGEG